MARLVLSLAKGKTSDDVTTGSGQSSSTLAVDMDLAAGMTDAEFDSLLDQILIYRRKNLAACTATA